MREHLIVGLLQSAAIRLHALPLGHCGGVGRCSGLCSRRACTASSVVARPLADTRTVRSQQSGGFSPAARSPKRSGTWMGAEPSRPGTRHSDGPDDSSNLLSPGKGSRAPTSKGKAGSSFRCAEPAVDEPASPPPPPQRRPQAARAQQRGQGPKGKPSKRDMSSEPEPAPCPGYVRRRHLNSGACSLICPASWGRR